MAVMTLQSQPSQEHRCSDTRATEGWTGGSGRRLDCSTLTPPAGCLWASVNGGGSREPSQPPHPPRATHINAKLISEGADQPIMHNSVTLNRLKAIPMFLHQTTATGRGGGGWGGVDLQKHITAVWEPILVHTGVTLDLKPAAHEDKGTFRTLPVSLPAPPPPSVPSRLRAKDTK